MDWTAIETEESLDLRSLMAADWVSGRVVMAVGMCWEND